MNPAAVLPIDEVVCPFYIRMHVQDKPGVLADITRILSDNHISIEAMQQKDVDDDEPVPILMMTHSVREADLNNALAKIASLPTVLDEIVRIRVELLKA